jgi:hypothetical protein
VYCAAFVRPEQVAVTKAPGVNAVPDLSVEQVTVDDPVKAVTDVLVAEVAALFKAGTWNTATICPLLAVTELKVGRSGTPAGTTDRVCQRALLPAAFEA